MKIQVYKGLSAADTKIVCPNCDEGELVWIEEQKVYVCSECGYEEER